MREPHLGQSRFALTRPRRRHNIFAVNRGSDGGLPGRGPSVAPGGAKPEDKTMERTKYWSRRKDWLKNGARKSGDDSFKPQGVATHVDGEDDPGDADAPMHMLSKRRRHDTMLEKLQEGYIQVVGLVDAIQKHQQRQDAHAQEICSSLSQMADTLNQIDVAGREQTEKLARIAEELRMGNERSVRWEEAIAQLPKMAEAQRESLSTVARQMEAVGRRDEQMSQSLDSFRDAVTSLSDASMASGVAVKNLQMSTLEAQERTAALVREQNKRFTMLFVVTLILAAVAILSGLLAIWKN
jgi:hypothetical protein